MDYEATSDTDLSQELALVRRTMKPLIKAFDGATNPVMGDLFGEKIRQTSREIAYLAAVQQRGKVTWTPERVRTLVQQIMMSLAAAGHHDAVQIVQGLSTAHLGQGDAIQPPVLDMPALLHQMINATTGLEAASPPPTTITVNALPGEESVRRGGAGVGEVGDSEEADDN